VVNRALERYRHTMATDDRKLDVLGWEIARYLADHPDAADSAEGIRRWWLLRQRFDEAALQVQRALDRLEAAGEVEKQVLPDGTVIYRAAPPPANPQE
jgi:Fe2+ or Zn2+ uptake regulation protein